MSAKRGKTFLEEEGAFRGGQLLKKSPAVIEKFCEVARSKGTEAESELGKAAKTGADSPQPHGDQDDSPVVVLEEDDLDDGVHVLTQKDESGHLPKKESTSSKRRKSKESGSAKDLALKLKLIERELELERLKRNLFMADEKERIRKTVKSPANKAATVRQTEAAMQSPLKRKLHELATKGSPYGKSAEGRDSIGTTPVQKKSKVNELKGEMTASEKRMLQKSQPRHNMTQNQLAAYRSMPTTLMAKESKGRKPTRRCPYCYFLANMPKDIREHIALCHTKDVNQNEKRGTKAMIAVNNLTCAGTRVVNADRVLQHVPDKVESILSSNEVLKMVVDILAEAMVVIGHETKVAPRKNERDIRAAFEILKKGIRDSATNEDSEEDQEEETEGKGEEEEEKAEDEQDEEEEETEEDESSAEDDEDGLSITEDEGDLI